MPSAIFVADGGHAVGGGHLMRCLTLARALGELGWRSTLIAPAEARAVLPAGVTPPLRLVTAPAAELHDPACVATLAPVPADLVVVDHYRLDHEFESAVRAWAAYTMAIDDLANRRHAVDVLLDQGHGRAAAAYTDLVSPATLLLLGVDYALVQPEFLAARPRVLAWRAAQKAPSRRIFLSVGATDPDGVTLRVLDLLHGAGRVADVTVAIGRHAPQLAALRSAAASRSFTLHESPRVDAMIQAMHSDFAIGGGGISTWERCVLGLPAIALVLADNQRANVAAVTAAGAARGVDMRASDGPQRLLAEVEELLVTPALTAMSKAAAALCDGTGAARVARRIAEVVRSGTRDERNR